MKKPKTKKKSVNSPHLGKKLALGRGLDALIPDAEPGSGGPEDYFQCDIDRIRPNRYQPRLHFSETELEDLSRSIREQGVIQPLLIRESDGSYELIAGERRLRASKLAGLRQVPVVLKTVTEAELLEMSIVENIQRENLNPVEEADAYFRLMEEFHLTQDQAAARVGKSRSAVANLVRLRQLPEQIKASIIEGHLSMGHARAILGVDTATKQNAVWREVLSKRLSVRQTEALVKRFNAEKLKPVSPDTTSDDVYFRDVADELSRTFGTKVEIKKRGKRGTVEIDFYSDDDLDRLLDLLKSA
jgi:ParB family chromosome partitioning protein